MLRDFQIFFSLNNFTTKSKTEDSVDLFFISSTKCSWRNPEIDTMKEVYQKMSSEAYRCGEMMSETIRKIVKPE